MRNMRAGPNDMFGAGFNDRYCQSVQAATADRRHFWRIFLQINQFLFSKVVAMMSAQNLIRSGILTLSVESMVSMVHSYAFTFKDIPIVGRGLFNCFMPCSEFNAYQICIEFL